MLDQSVLRACQAHARAEYPRECCGLVVAGQYLPQTNAAADPAKDFFIATAAWLAHAGRIEAVLHSHPVEPGEHVCPSARDMRGQIDSALPWGLVGVTADQVTDVILWGDMLPIRPLVGRPFVHGIWDCYALVRDYFRLEGRGTLPQIPRDYEWWTEAGGQALYAEGLRTTPGVRVIRREEIRPGDVLLLRYKSRVTNHAAVYLGDGTILHHMDGELSRRDDASAWARFATHFVRYEGGANG